MEKLKIILCLCFIPLLLPAQVIKDRIIYLDSLEKLSNEDNYVLLRILKNYYSNSDQCEVYDYYKSGKLKMAGTLKDKYRYVKTGNFVSYYENGNKESIVHYVDNMPIGKFYSWYEKGAKEIVGEFLKPRTNPNKPFLRIDQYWSRIGIQRVVDGNGHFQDEDITSFSEGEMRNGFKNNEWSGNDFGDKTTFTEKYKEGELVSGISIDSVQASHSYKELFTPPKPLKGDKHFVKYIYDNIVVPFEEDHNHPKGKMIIEFVVDRNGWINHVKVLQGVGYGLDEEAVRIMRNYDQWKPAEKRGIKFDTVFTIPINIWSPK
jgi:TonB family protein